MSKVELLKRLSDKPLSRKETDLFVNRESEMNLLKEIVEYHSFGIFGLCGRTGSGKTTLLNMVSSKEEKIVPISLVYRESSDSILYNMLYSLAENFLKTKGLEKLAKQIKEWITKEVSTVRGFSLGVSLVGSANLDSGKTTTPRFNIFKAHEYLRKILIQAKKEFGKVVLLIDELDKEKKEEVIKILDSLKFELLQEDVVTIVTLPQSIYKEYIQDRLRMNGVGNLENVIKDVVLIKDLQEHHIKEMLIRRFDKDLEWLEDTSILDVLANFSDGNPRDALWITQKVVIKHIKDKKLTYDSVIETIKEVSEEFLRMLSLTELQRKALNVLKGFSGTREEFVSLLTSKGFARSTAYDIFEKFLTNGLLVQKEGYVKITGKIV
ncbi:ATP-binding protein [Pseudothermotoga thermarum]|uniref:AAA ATPase n=1 Tax=Pseudothermotoga thermarum DSM 5069 TaxID=688269 RepID=F7YUS8_9THEM|nr:ATP-binding protein [Pseudothermotoga thermarum]AEH50266.1 AAA ATPase [Pseudothermotoga thermarum DSM 5069]